MITLLIVVLVILVLIVRRRRRIRLHGPMRSGRPTRISRADRERINSMPSWYRKD
jgi:hypothetical protein